MRKNMIWTTAIAALLIGVPAYAELSTQPAEVISETEELEKAPEITLSDIEHPTAREWRLNIEVVGHPMREARIDAIDKAIAHVKAPFDEAAIGDGLGLIEKVLTLDEKYDVGHSSYSARLRIVTGLDDPGFELGAKRRTDFDSGDLNVPRPDWVMLMPMTVDASGHWQLAGRSSSWAAQWTVPFRDGTTQFIATMADADDLKANKTLEEFEPLAEFLAQKYRAAHIAFVAKVADGRFAVAYWDDAAGRLSLGPIGEQTSSMGVTERRANLLEHFWPIYSDTLNAIATAPEETANSDVGVKTIGYRVLGKLKSDAMGVSGYLQLILDENQSWKDVLYRLSQVPNFMVFQDENRGTSGVVMFAATVSGEDALRQLLSENGFTPDRG